jgi:hypothetical protein
LPKKKKKEVRKLYKDRRIKIIIRTKTCMFLKSKTLRINKIDHVMEVPL